MGAGFFVQKTMQSTVYGSKADPAYRTRIERIGYEYVPSFNLL